MAPSSAPTPSHPSRPSGRRCQHEDDLRYDDDDDDIADDDNHDIDFDDQVRVCDPCTRDQEWRRKMHLVLDQLRASTLLTQVLMIITLIKMIIIMVIII